MRLVRNLLIKIFKLLEKLPWLNDRQLDRLSEFFANLSIVIGAGFIFPNLVGNTAPKMVQLEVGIASAGTALIISLFLIRRQR